MGSTTLRRRSWQRRLKASLRDTWVLIREFRGALFLYSLMIILASWSFQVLWNASHPVKLSFSETVFGVLTMTFFASNLEFPGEWYLQLYFFSMPVAGLAFLGRGAADFVTLLFNRSTRQSQWEEAVASTFENHIVVCGLGRLGVRVVRELLAMDQEVVVVERGTTPEKLSEMQASDTPLISGDARTTETLAKAGVGRASAVVVCTNDDLMNIQIAGRIRELNPTVRLVMRMFDDQFARSMADRFDISAVFSASMLAAPAFAGAATGAEILQTFKVADQVMVMGRVVVEAGSRLDGMSIADVEDKIDLSVVLRQTGDQVDVHPEQETRLHGLDVIAIVGALSALKTLTGQYNRKG